jgi:ubiquinone/menaquinone biosynthesis C-methylase UbiE
MGIHDTTAYLMRSDWNQRAREDANYYVAFASYHQPDDEFLATAGLVLPALTNELSRLPSDVSHPRRALEIGCGPGRLILQMNQYFDEIHGIDVSDEMIRLAQDKLSHVSHAFLHATTGTDLALFQNNWFDFAYSFAVFQHIPSTEIVFNYLDETVRVLKPGGIGRFQFRGVRPNESQLVGASSTWTGCFLSAEEIISFCKDRGVNLLALSGEATQYMWATIRKARTDRTLQHGQPCFGGLTASDHREAVVPQRGRSAAISLWLSDLPDDCDLLDLKVAIDSVEQRGCWLSPKMGASGYQLNVMLPPLAPGSKIVECWFRGIKMTGEHSLVIQPALRDPHVVSIRDGINLLSPVVEAARMKVVLEEIEGPEKVNFKVRGCPVSDLEFVCTDPVAEQFEYSLLLPKDLDGGTHLLEITVSGNSIPPVEFQVAKSRERVVKSTMRE